MNHSTPQCGGRWVAATAIGLLACGPVFAQNAPKVGPKLAMVNTMQGTDSVREFSHGNVYPLVCAPFGMTDWSVQNCGDIEERFYFQSRRHSFVGVRATHQPSPWAGDYGQFMIVPETGPAITDANARACEYDAARTVMRPDYLRIRLDRYNVTAEVTATERAAVWRLSFDPKVGTGRLVFDLPGESQFQMRGNRLWGYTKHHYGPAAGDFHCYFAGELDRPISGGKTVEGRGAGYVEFATGGGKPVILRIATSFISPELAELNLKRETAGGFDAVRASTAQAWEKLLSRIDVHGQPDRERTFYSCLYRALKYPRKIYEFDTAGRMVHYSPWNGKVEEGPAYTDTGLWDTFRTQFPLLSIAYPDVFGEILNGWMNAYKEGGWLPHWPNPGGFRAMPGNYADTMVADAMVKGIRGFDYSTAYAALRKDAFEVPVGKPGQPVGGKADLEEYMRLGYVPEGKTEYWVSMTLDYAYNDWCVAQAAKLMGRRDDYLALMKRSQNYRNLWDPSVGFMRSKDANGNWSKNFDEYAWGGPYAESGAWQSSWNVQQDVLGLADLVGGPDAFGRKMDDLFTHPPIFGTGAYNGVIHEMIEFVAVGMGQYGACNQPSFHLPYLFAGVGQPWKTEYWTRQACRRLFNAGPDGILGDDDNGSNSSWYLLSSMGIYPLTPGHPSYVLTSPEFDSVTIRPPSGKTISIAAKGNSERAVYVGSRSVNGKPWSRIWISHADLVNGAKIVDTMSEKPGIREVAPADLPYSAKTELASLRR